jgi:hypothetical protein
MLVGAGARRIMTEYDDDGRAVGVAFTVETARGERSFLLPVNSAPVLDVLKRQKVSGTYLTPEHAERVAWRIIKDWLEAQLAIIATEMVTLDQVMLPYMATGGGTTMWDLYRDSQLALPGGE